MGVPPVLLLNQCMGETPMPPTNIETEIEYECDFPFQ